MRISNFFVFFTITLLLFQLNCFAQTPTITTISTAGAGSWTVPAGVFSVDVECWGGGGGGGYATGVNGAAGGGGGGGGYSKTLSIAVSPGQTLNYNVGSGGAGGTTVPVAASSGADTWFSSSTTVLAKGGQAGAGSSTATVGTGGTGGASASGFGTIKYSGGNGAAGIGNTGGGGGGAGASQNAAGANASGITGGVGVAPGGSGGNGASNSPGVAGTTYGGGGAGGEFSPGGKAGGNGASGSIILTYTVCSFSSTASNTGPYCPGQTISLTTTTLSGASYSWTGPNGFTSNLQSPTITSSTTTNSGVYTVTVTVPGCTNTAVSSTTVTVYTSTSISSQSTVSQSVCQGSSFSPLFVTASGTTPTYQWYSNVNPSTTGGTSIAGAVNSSYTPPSFSIGITYYYCVVSGTCGTATTSVSGAMTVSSAPTISGANNICQGSFTTLTATGSGNTWSSSNTTIANVNTSGFVSGNSPGTTSILCMSPAGCISTYSMTVNAVPVITSTSALSVCSGNALNQTLTANPSAGTTFSWYALNNVNVNGESTTSQNGNTLNNTLTNTTTTTQNVLYSVNATSSVGCVGNQTVTVSVVALPSFNVSSFPSTICSGDSSTLKAVQENLDYSQSSINQISRWMIGNTGWQSFVPTQSGKLVKLKIRTVTYSTSANITVRVYSGNPGSGTLLSSYAYSKGTYIDSWDDIPFPNGGPSVSSGSNYYIEIPAGAAIDWPYSTTNPYGNGQAWYGVSPSVIPSEDFNFETYIDPNSYSWNPGSLNGSIVIVGPTSLTTYTATATNVGGCVSTNTVIVDVNSASVGGTASSNQTICTGSSPSPLTITGNTGNIQWQESSDNITWTNISGATVSPLTSAQMGTLNITKYYRVTSTNGVCSTAYSNTVTVAVSPVSVGGLAASNQTICSGSTPTSLTLSGNTGSIQWQSSTDNLTWTNIGGATSSTLISSSIGPLSANTYFRAAITSGTCPNANSNTVTITVNPTASISSQSTASQTICVGSSFTPITVTASGGGLTYQWYSNSTASTTGGTAIVGATASTYTPPSATAGTNYYYAIVNGTCGTATSAISGAMVVNPNNTITLSSAPGTSNQTVCVNGSITNINYATSGATGATFSGLPAGVTGNWIANLVTITGSPLSSGTFNYSVTMSGGCAGTGNSVTGTIVVNANNFISLTSAFGSNNQGVCVNSAISPITYATSGATGAIFSGLPSGVTGSWASNSININGTPTISATHVYTVTSTGGCGGTIVTGTITVNPSPSTNVVVSSLNSGLVGWYPFSGNANDQSGNGYNGTVSGPTLTTDRFGNANKAYSFNGSPGNQISVAHNTNFNTYPITISAWVKSDSTFNGGTFISKYINASWNGWNFGMGYNGVNNATITPYYLSSSSPCTGVIEGYSICGSPVGMNYTGPANDGNWHHVVFRVDSWGGLLYLDGVQVGQQAWIGTPGPVTTTTPILIGPDFEGSIDDIGIWNRALTTSEISYLYNSGTASICNGSSIAISGTGASSYSWNTGANTQTITVAPTSSTTYTVTGSSSAGCTASNSFTVNVIPNTIPSVSIAASSTNICAGNIVTFTATPNNGGTSPAYQWKINNINVTGATASTFTTTSLNNNDVVTVQLNSNATPCLSGNPVLSLPITISVNQLSVPSVSIGYGAGLICQGTTVNFTATPNTGTVTPTYNWLLNGNPISGATNSTYSTASLNNGDSVSVLINLNQGCFTTNQAVSSSVGMNVSSGLNALISGSNNICYGESNGFIDATTTGGIAPYTYSWNNGATTEDQSNLAAGTYSVTITDAAGCIFNSSFLIYQPPSPLSVSVNSTNVSCSGYGNGAIDLSVSGGYGQYLFFWSNGSNTEDQTQLSPGNYWVNVYDYNSCSFSDTITISEPQAISTSLNIISTPCANDSSGSIDLTVTGGTSPYVYFWSNGFNGEDPASLPSGNYQITTLDNNGCADTNFISLSSTASTNINAQNTFAQSICQGSAFNTIDVSASGGAISYQWYENSTSSVSGATPVSGANSSVFSPPSLTTGTIYYFCIATGSCGVDTSAISGGQTVSIILTPSVSISSSSGTICSGNNISFFANPSNEGTNPVYDWQINGISTGINNDTLTTSILNNGDVVSLSMTSNANCLSVPNATSNNLNITIDALTNINNESLLSQNVCLNDTFLPLSITASGSNLSYQWFSNSTPAYSGGINLSGGTSSSYQSASGIPGTLYYYCVVSGTCGVDTSNISGAQTVNNISQPSATIVASDTSICSGTNISFSANITNGGSNPSFQWTINGVSVTGANNSNFSSSAISNSDVINLILSPGSGSCTNSTPVTSNGITINVVQTPTLTVSNTGPYCESSTIQLNCSSNGMVNWSGPNTFNSSLNNPTIPLSSILSGGAYIATVTTGTCVATDTTFVTINTNPVANAGPNQTINCLNNTATLNGSSSIPSVAYNWNGSGIVSGTNSSSCVANVSGNYILTVTEISTGCMGTDTVFIVSNTMSPSVNADSSQTITCAQPSVTINSITSDTGIVYNWNPPGSSQNTASTIVNVPGNYTITVTFTATGCSATDVVNVMSTGNFPNVNAGINQLLTCTVQNATLTGSSSTQNTVAAWLPPGTNPYSLVNNVTTPGAYILTVTDTTNGCSSSDTVVVNYDGSDCGDIEFYNGITPNGDGKNDVFYIKNISNFPTNHFTIFNRYGAKTWEGSDYNNTTVVFKGLDENGSDLPPGTYYYILEYDGKIAKGWIELMR